MGPDGLGGGGVARVVRALVEEYESLGHEVVVLYPRRRALVNECTSNKVPFGISWLPQAAVYWNVNAICLAWKLRRRSVDVAHVHGAAGWARYLRVPSVFTAHGRVDFPISKLGWPGRIASAVIRRIERRSARRFEAVTAQTKAGSMHFFDGVAELVPNPVSPEFFSDLTDCSNRNAFRLLVVGRITKDKGVLEAIRWFKESATAGEMIVVGQAGEDVYIHDCRAEAQNHGRPVSFYHPKDAAGVAAVMAGGGALFIPSLEENAPLVIGEALAAGLPVVANDVGAIGEMLEGCPGCLVSENVCNLAWEDVAGLLTANADMPEWRSDRKAMAEQYRLENVAKKFLSIMSGAVAKYA